jgi:type I restriction enzyme R subunit
VSSIRTGNFEFLDTYDGRVAKLARQAEDYVYLDPDSCLFKLRLIIETMARTVVELQSPNYATSDLGTMLGALQRSGILPRSTADSMHAIRRDGNAAVHGSITPSPTAMRRLHDLHRLSRWYCATVKRGAKVRIREFIPPSMPASTGRRERAVIAEAERLEDDIEQRRRATRESLLLFESDVEAERESARLRKELEALHRVALEAGEPLVDADSVVLLMAMEIEQLLEHPRLGMTSREAKQEAEKQLDAVKRQLDEHEQEYAAERARLLETTA